MLVVIVAVFAIAATSLVVIQIDQTRQTYSISGNLFNTTVGNAMDNVVSELESDSTAAQVSQMRTFGYLDSLIADELLEAGVDLDPEVGIYDATTDEFYYCSRAGMEGKLRTSPFKYSFHPTGVYSPNQYFIVLAFPSAALFLRQNAHLYVYMSIFLIVIVALLFVFSVVIIVNLSKVDEMKTTFVNNMTHEIKTPIATIALACEMLGEQQPDGQPNTALGIIADENRRMRLLVETILQSSKMSDPHFPLNRREVDVHTVVGSVLQSFRMSVSNAGGSIETHLEAEPHIIFADELHITNMVYNLIDNAIKYSNGQPRVIVSTSCHSGVFSLSVEDHGIGIAKSEQKRIFDKFYRVSTGDVHNVKGFGIGLNYVAQVVRLHKGHIALQSEPGKGSKFTVSLPCGL